MDKKLSLQEYPTCIKLWLSKSVKSERKQGAINLLYRFFKETNIDPEKLVAEWKKARFDPVEKEKFLIPLSEKIVEYHAINLKEKGYALGTINTAIFRIIGFFRANMIPIVVDIEPDNSVTFHNEDITKEQIRRILKHADLKYRLFYLMMVESGIRPNTLTQLKYEHIKKDYEVNKIPMCIQTPAYLLKKIKEDRFSFIGEDAFKLLQEYLKTRGKLSNNDLIFGADIKNPRIKGHLTTSTFSTCFARIVQKLKLVEKREDGKPSKLRLYCLRKYFRNNMLMPQNEREYLMGHSIGVDSHYISNDPEYYRVLYEKGYPNLRIFEEGIGETSLKVKQLENKMSSKDKQIEELNKKVTMLTKIMTRLIEKPENMEHYQEAYGYLEAHSGNLEATVLDQQRRLEELEKKLKEKKDKEK